MRLAILFFLGVVAVFGQAATFQTGNISCGAVKRSTPASPAASPSLVQTYCYRYPPSPVAPAWVILSNQVYVLPYSGTFSRQEPYCAVLDKSDADPRKWTCDKYDQITWTFSPQPDGTLKWTAAGADGVQLAKSGTL